jgi:ribosomal-protein-alanine N-acetyltransferase
MAAPFRIRTADPADAAGLASLERRCFSDPWSETGLREMLGSPQVIARVAERRGAIVGYAFARWVMNTGEIMNLAVAPEHRRQGLARRLLDALLDGLLARGVTEVFLEVRASNQAAQALYLSRGFQVAGMRRAYYRRPTEDALVLRLQWGGVAEKGSATRIFG